MALSLQDKRIISRLSGDLPEGARPFYTLSQGLNLTEEELLKKIKTWKKKGLLRKFAAVLNHYRLGYKANAMVVWKIPEERVMEAAGIISSFAQVSHCYERKTTKDWPYNIFMVVHGERAETCERVIDEVSARTGINDYEVLYSTKQFKKTSMMYFR